MSRNLSGMNDKEFDDFLKGLAESPDIPYKEEDWEVMKARLAGASAKPLPWYRKSFIRWISALIVLALLSFLGWSVWMNESTVGNSALEEMTSRPKDEGPYSSAGKSERSTETIPPMETDEDGQRLRVTESIEERTVARQDVISQKVENGEEKSETASFRHDQMRPLPIGGKRPGFQAWSVPNRQPVRFFEAVESPALDAVSETVKTKKWFAGRWRTFLCRQHLI